MFGRITRWLLLFLENEFTIVYKPNKTRVVADVLSRLSDSLKPLGRCIIILYRTYMDARNQELFGDRSYAINFEPSSKTKISYKGRTFYS